ncbi:ImmA/IrrE family metallo-endopeptidase [Kocuria rhizophila]|uniref:ImmA/IrrE family metallo-endopeptidase n=1 Tax=Kocuria rhizophila TaxID=72000 RepID=A0AAX2SI50_KOCRH|nr:ImmA/IrrE family metallo-endopeptidase [Kocuria rhizophila]TFI02580.1 ImmA/IrrE family metallo-endopeptidase [Kocuria rhizophila]TFI07892.1 ImmA/IrrE family metallo-endopeptidase [Kocuria rhizophila]
MFDPWVLTDKDGTFVHRAPLRVASGCTDGRHVWLNEHLTDVEARCALTHELVHISRGHTRHQPAAVEDDVQAQTARLLVPWEAITEHAGSQLDQWHLAQELGVTERVLIDRLHFASTVELQALRETAVWG